MISLSGLAVAVGMLVDNSVVVIENIYRLRAKGATVIQAAVSGARQVLGAITASTLTTVCVFLPIVFVEGITKQLFKMCIRNSSHGDLCVEGNAAALHGAGYGKAADLGQPGGTVHPDVYKRQGKGCSHGTPKGIEVRFYQFGKLEFTASFRLIALFNSIIWL